MNYFECCRGCVSPKRYPGCSDKCPEYRDGRVRLEADKARKKRFTALSLYTKLHVERNRDNTAKKNRHFGQYKHL